MILSLFILLKCKFTKSVSSGLGSWAKTKPKIMILFYRSTCVLSFVNVRGYLFKCNFQSLLSFWQSFLMYCLKLQCLPCLCIQFEWLRWGSSRHSGRKNMEFPGWSATGLYMVISEFHSTNSASVLLFTEWD